MKSVTLVYLLLMLFLSTLGQKKAKHNQFLLKGKIVGQTKGLASLTYNNNKGKQIKDTAILKNGHFFFTGFINEPTIAFIRGAVRSIADDDPNTTSFYLEPGNMTAIVERNNFKKIKVTGSKTQQEFEMLQKKYDAIKDASDSAYEKFSKINNQFIIAYPNSYVSAFLLTLYKTRWPLDSVRKRFSRLSPLIQKSFYGKEVARSIGDVDDNTSGKMGKHFTAVDINGDSISLSDFKGRFILLDFWASWCVPCRQGTPHLLELFKKYHEKGLEIIAVSDDDDIEAWKMAVKKDKVGIWYNILSSAKSNEAIDKFSISKKYGVHVLPTKFLVDRNGIIIGRYTGTEEESVLDQKLSEIFK